MPIKDRRSEFIPFFVAYFVFMAVRNIIDKFAPKKFGVIQLWVQIKIKSMC